MKEVLADYCKQLLVAAAIAALLAWPVFRMLLAMRSHQTVSEYAPEGHQKKQGTPTMGGIMVVLGLALGVFVLGLANRELYAMLWMLGFALIGFADDYLVPRLMPGKRGLGWKPKMVAQMALAVAAVPVLGWEWSVPGVALAVFVVLFACNAYNFADGLDGLAGSLGIVLSLGFAGLLALKGWNQEGWVVICGAMAGALIPFLFLNAPPARVFMGDVGSLPLGALMGLFACVLIAPYGPSSFSLSDATWVVILSGVLIAELVPVPLQVLSVKLTGKRLFLMTPIHHAFEKRGWPETRIVFAFVLAQIVLTAGALALAGVSWP